MRRRTLKIGEALRNVTMSRPETAPSAIDASLDSTFIRNCEDGEQYLEVIVGNVETEAGGQQIFGAVAKSGTDRRWSAWDEGRVPPSPSLMR